MTASSITITFNRDPFSTGDYCEFRVSNGINSLMCREDFTFKPRTGPGEVNAGSPIPGAPGRAAAIAFANAINLDYNSSNILDINVSNNSVAIRALDGWDFFDFSSTLATAVINNTPSSPYKVIDYSLTLSRDYHCDFVGILVNTSRATSKVYINNNLTETFTGNGPYLINIPRETLIRSVYLESLGGEKIPLMPPKLAVVNEPLFYFNKLYASNIDINITHNPMKGATVVFKVTFPGQLKSTHNNKLSYSLDGVNYSNRYVYTGQFDGDYTLYVKDEFGCVVSKQYTVSPGATYGAYMHISKINSISFALEEEWSCGIPKNDNNTLSGTELMLDSISPIQENILLQKCDPVIPIQFKSNYEEHIVTLEGCDEDIEINIEKKSNNLNVFTRLDARMYSNNGFLALYFSSGNIYDEFNSVIGEYALNGNLPDFIDIGNYVNISGIGTLTVTNIAFNDELNKKIAMFDYPYYDDEVGVLVDSTYNILPYEVYQFDLKLSGLEEGLYRIKIEAKDDFFKNRTYYSEYIDLREEHPNTLEIIYYDNDNKDIFYLYDIKHFLRVPFLSISAYIKDTIEIVSGDNSSYVVDSLILDGNSIEFGQVTKNLLLKLIIALSSPNLTINNIGYVKDGGVEYEKLDGINLYSITANLLKSNKEYLGSSRKLELMQVSNLSRPHLLPNLLTDGNSLIKV